MSVCTPFRAAVGLSCGPGGLWHAARLIHMAGHEPGPSLLCIVGQGSEMWSEAVSGLAVSHRPLSMLTLGGGVR